MYTYYELKFQLAVDSDYYYYWGIRSKNELLRDFRSCIGNVYPFGRLVDANYNYKPEKVDYKYETISTWPR